MKTKLTKTEIGFNSDLQWFKKKGYLNGKGINFVDRYNDYINTWMGIREDKTEKNV